MTFPAIVDALMAAGLDGYLTDLRAGETRYYAPGGDSRCFSHAHPGSPVALAFDGDAVRDVIREAQERLPDYRYLGFLDKIAAAGCAGYVVSFPGRRVLYFGRDGETHVEHFPRAAA
ncbi:MAG: DUF1398 domain-containing protein [Proteobacteria bacterium]|nr:DUF1398 domain-containing protein [Pseudomonadota bacterium]